MHKTADPQQIPPEIFAIEGQKNIFQIRFNQTGKTTDFILDQVFNKIKRQQTPTIPMEPATGTTPTPLAITNQEHHEENTKEQSEPKAMEKQSFEDEPGDAKKIKGTPAAHVASTNQEHHEDKPGKESKPKPVKRQLFQDEPGNAKKLKAGTLLFGMHKTNYLPINNKKTLP
ncbi:hypothetical protein CTI12_AA570580 [Artemisia annua]|uniref:Uncharacterized protein n=1 Tax=Artemisia annua TaxID=35608 RepID=A0A2U1KRR1_ARTAN|nr:hypothetical protein CTI12_AA570580 [Artemisia annua]